MPSNARPDAESSGRHLPALAAAALLLGAIALLGSLGGPLGPIEALAVVLVSAVQAGAAPAAYLFSAWGLGRLGDGLWRSSPERGLLRLGLGLALLLSLSHLLGILGVLTPVVAAASLAPGLALGVHALVVESRRAPAPGGRRGASPWLLFWAVPAAVLLVASANPPGWLWASEFGGYDALSYHLQLPQEWLARGRVWPLEHNAYSFLPGYLEVAFFHLARATFAPAPVPGAGEPLGLLAGGGWRALMPQMLHAQLTLLAAWGARRVVVRFAALAGLAGQEDEGPGEDAAGDGDEADEAAERRAAARSIDAAGWLAGALVLATPWVVVVGSLAYNEMGVALLAAAAVGAAVEPAVRPWARGLLCGVLMGAVASVKPTGLLLLGPVVGLLLGGAALRGGRPPRAESDIASTPRADGPHHPMSDSRRSAPLKPIAVAFAIAAIAGLLTLAPWLVRNAIASGTPVFPQAAGVFGAGHWSAEQADRWAEAHRFEGPLVDRFAIAFAPGGSRGALHEQWFAFWPIVAVAGLAALASRRARALAALLLVGLAGGLLAWLALTHVQSRFLLPLAIPGAALAGLAAAAWTARQAPARVDAAIAPAERRLRIAMARLGGLGAAAALVLVQAGALLSVFAEQRRGRPNMWLGPGPHAPGPSMSGLVLREELQTMRRREREEVLAGLPPIAYMNLTLPAGEAVYLLGDATPFALRPPVLWHTTWDRSPLGELVREHPGEPDSWTGALRERGVRWVLVNFAELERFLGDGWYDEAVTPRRVRRWIEDAGEAQRAWPAGASPDRAWSVLYRLGGGGS